jgi:hypothetical protein
MWDTRQDKIINVSDNQQQLWRSPDSDSLQWEKNYGYFEYVDEHMSS